MKLSPRLMLPAQSGMLFVLRRLVRLRQLQFESNSQCVRESFLLWLQERTVNTAEATDMEMSVPRDDIIYLKRTAFTNNFVVRNKTKNHMQCVCILHTVHS